MCTYLEYFCDQKSALLWWLTSCCEKEWKNDVLKKKGILSRRANNKRLPALHLKLHMDESFAYGTTKLYLDNNASLLYRTQAAETDNGRKRSYMQGRCADD